ncbi:MAG TPA: CHAT domain-containing protein, partial [Thermoanaerobaculia bacterium]
ARSLVEILDQAGAGAGRSADPALADRARRLRETVDALEVERLEQIKGGAADAEVQAAAARLNEALAEASEVEGELRAGSAGYAALTAPQPLTLAAIREQVLDGSAVLLEYWLGGERSTLWVVTPDALQSFRLPPRGEIEDLAKRYYAQLTARNHEAGLPVAERTKRRAAADAAAAALGRELSALLLAPAADLLGDRPLLVVADGALQYIPFRALPSPGGGGPLLAKHDVVALPSASALAALRREVRARKPPERTLAVLADPVFQRAELVAQAPPPAAAGATLRGDVEGDLDRGHFRRLAASEKEAAAISRLVPAGQKRLWTRFSASRQTATSGELSHYAYVHFATHGLLDSTHPERSSLVLSLLDKLGRPQNGYLRLDDVYNLHLNARLVVLSACQTALGKTIRGEGLLGLTRGFMYAGAERVVATLWSVEDRPTTELMRLLYGGMLKGGLSPAAALRRAQLAMAAGTRYAAPYFWAGFQLQGEWR